MPHKDRAILFDLGDTLIHYGDIDRRRVFEHTARRTYALWASRNQRMPGYQRYYLHHWGAMMWGSIKTMVFRREMDAMRLIRRACRKLWLDAPQPFFDELMWRWYEPLLRIATVEPDTRDVLGELQSRGFALGIVSNTFVPGWVLDRHLEMVGLLSYFPVRVYSADVRYRKPDRRIFEMALDQLSVEPSRAMFVGDLYSTDIVGAERAGLKPVWKRNNPSSNGSPHRPHTVHRLNELPDLAAELLPAVTVPAKPRRAATCCEKPRATAWS